MWVGANQKTQDEPQWIVAQRLLSALTIPGFQLSRLQKIYHFQSLKLRLTTKPLMVIVARVQQGRDLMLVM